MSEIDGKSVFSRAQRLIRKGWGKGSMAGTRLYDNTEDAEYINTIADPADFYAPKVAYVCAVGGIDRALWIELGKPNLSTVKARNAFQKQAKQFHDLLDDVAIAAAQRKFGGSVETSRYSGKYLSTDEGSFTGIIDFNDHNDVTKDEVLAVFATAKKRLG